MPRPRAETTPMFGPVLMLLMDEREAQGVSQSEMARRLGMRPSVLSRIERGHHEPNLSTLFRYAAALNMEIRLGVGRPGADIAGVKHG